MAWIEDINRRSRKGKSFKDGSKNGLLLKLSPIHYESVIDSGVFDTEINCELSRINNSQLDGWVITQNNWHYAIGIPGDGILAGQDGVVGFGGRKGQHWFKYRLIRVGYLHWPTRDFQDVGGAPTYSRTNLSSETRTKEYQDGNVQNIATVGQWNDIWSIGDGSVNIEFSIKGSLLKENIIITQAAREWIEANEPPTTPADETYFGFVFRIDPTDIPKWIKNDILQDINGDFDDGDGYIELQDSVDRLLAFLPVSYGYVFDENSLLTDPPVKLRKRIFKEGSDWFLTVGARVDELNTLSAGNLNFDPNISDSIDDTNDDGYENADTGWNYSYSILKMGTDNVGGGYWNHTGISWQLHQDLTDAVVAQFTKMYVRAYCIAVGDDTSMAHRLQSNAISRLDSVHLPTDASWVVAREEGSVRAFSTSTWYFGESDTYPWNYVLDLEALPDEKRQTGDWLNTCFWSDNNKKSDYVDFESYDSAGTNEPELYIEWVAHLNVNVYDCQQVKSQLV